MKKRFKIMTLAVALVITFAGLYLGIYNHRFFATIDKYVYDSRLRARVTHETPEEIILVDIDEKSMAAEGRWGWPRAKFAQLVDKLDAAGARVIAFDAFFSEPDVGENDKIFAEAINRSKAAIILGHHFFPDARDAEHISDKEKQGHHASIVKYKYLVRSSCLDGDFTQTIPAAAATAAIVPELCLADCSFGYLNINCDSDGIARSLPAVTQFGQGLYSPLSLQIAAAYLDVERLVLKITDCGPNGIIIGDITVPTGRWGEMYINYRHKASSFQKVSATDILHDKVDPSKLRNKIAIIGATAVGIGDFKVIPVDDSCYGVFVHAAVVDSILAKDFIVIPDWAGGLMVVSVFAFGLLSGLILAFFRGLWGTPILIAIIILYEGVTRYVFANNGVFISPVYPIATALAVLFASLIIRVSALQNKSAETATPSSPSQEKEPR